MNISEFGVGARDAGLSLSAAMSSCSHQKVDPVLLSTEELVAAMCIDCLAEVPKSWIS